MRWRALTLVILHDLFGADLVPGAVLPEAALVLFQRAAPLPWLTDGPDLRTGKGKRTIDAGAERVHRLSKRRVHRLNGNFEGERRFRPNPPMKLKRQLNCFSACHFMSDKANLLDIMENDKMGRLGRYFVAKSAATR